MHCDSQSTIYLAKNLVYHTRTKHIVVRFHKKRELIVTKDIFLEKVHTSENAAMLTKPVPVSNVILVLCYGYYIQGCHWHPISKGLDWIALN